MFCDAKKLQELGYSLWLIKGITRAGKTFGDNPFIGRYAYNEDIEAWLHKHSDFVASRTLRSRLPFPGKHNPVKSSPITGKVDHNGTGSRHP
jgi:hypothetical protein